MRTAFESSVGYIAISATGFIIIIYHAHPIHYNLKAWRRLLIVSSSRMIVALIFGQIPPMPCPRSGAKNVVEQREKYLLGNRSLKCGIPKKVIDDDANDPLSAIQMTNGTSFPDDCSRFPIVF